MRTFKIDQQVWVNLQDVDALNIQFDISQITKSLSKDELDNSFIHSNDHGLLVKEDLVYHIAYSITQETGDYVKSRIKNSISK